MLRPGAQRATALTSRSVSRVVLRPQACSAASPSSVLCSSRSFTSNTSNHRISGNTASKPFKSRRITSTGIVPARGFGFGRPGRRWWNHGSWPYTHQVLAHRLDCQWLNSDGDPRITPRDKRCHACREDQAQDFELSRKELEWQREQQKALAARISDDFPHFFDLVGKNPYEALFGLSNRRLRGAPLNTLSSHSWARRCGPATPWSFRRWVPGYAPDTHVPMSQSSGSASRMESKQHEDSTFQDSEVASPPKSAKRADDLAKEPPSGTGIPTITAAVSWSTSGVHNGQHFSSSGEFIYDPITMRMVPKQHDSLPSDKDNKPQEESKIAGAVKPEVKSHREEQATCPSESPRKNFQEAKQALEASWASENRKKLDSDKNAESDISVPKPQPLETALDRVSQKSVNNDMRINSNEDVHDKASKSVREDSKIVLDSTLENLANLPAPRTFVRAEPKTPAHALFYQLKLRALREMAENSKWIRQCLTAGKQDRIGSILSCAEVKALAVMSKQNHAAFHELPKVNNYDLAEEQSHLNEMKMRQAEWEAKASAQDQIPAKSEWSSSTQAWAAFKQGKSNVAADSSSDNATRTPWRTSTTTPSSIQYSPKEARHACLSVFQRDMPLRYMTRHQLNSHRQALTKVWSLRTMTQPETKADRLLNEEINAQKSAMANFESRWLHKHDKAQHKTASPTAEHVPTVAAGEGDLDSKVTEYTSSTKWFKQKAPHSSLKESAQEQRDRQLVQDIKNVYESTYGPIDVSHSQPVALEQSLEEYESRIGKKGYDFKTEKLGRAKQNATASSPMQSLPLGTASPSPTPIQPATDLSHALNMYRKQCDSYAEHIGRLQKIIQQQKTAQKSNDDVSKAQTKQQATASTSEQHIKDLNKLLDMYRSQSDGYVEAIGRLQRKVQSSQLRAERLKSEQHIGSSGASDGKSRRSGIPTNPVDGTTSRQPELISQMGNFASPTGFVGEFPQVEHANDGARSDSTASASTPRIVRREEAVFSGQQPLQKASVQEIVNHLQDRLGTASKSSPPNSSTPPREPKGRRNAFMKKPARATQPHSTTFGERVVALFVSMVCAGAFLAACAYAVGVVIEYFRDGPSSSGDGNVPRANVNEPGWNSTTRSRRPSPERQRVPPSVSPALSANDAHYSSEELTKLSTLLGYATVGLGFACACILAFSSLLE